MESFEDSPEDALMAQMINENPRDLRFSNFMLTISTNVIPVDIGERVACVRWLRFATEQMLDDWDVINGTVLKPAGTDNAARTKFPNDHKIISVKSRVSLERGSQRGQMHAHVLLEVAHRYVERVQNRRYVGVHVNRDAIQRFLDELIPEMDIPYARRPEKIYVNSRLLTKGTDNSNKWLTLAYISKDRDVHGLNLAAQRQRGTPEERNIREGMLRPDGTYSSSTWEPESALEDFNE